MSASSAHSLRRVPLLPLAGLAITVVAGIAALVLSFAVGSANRWVAHSIRTQVAIVEVGEELAFYKSAYRGYMVRANASLLPDVDAAYRQLFQRLDLLRNEMSDNPVQVRNLAALEPLIRARVAEAELFASRRPHQTLDDVRAQGLASRGRVLMRQIRALMNAMFVEEERLRVERQRRTELLTGSLALGLAIAVTLVVIVAYMTMRDARDRYYALEQAHDRARAEMAAREAAESELRQAHKMETIGQLTGGIAHDFNNMLAVIIGSLDMARRSRGTNPERVDRGIAAALSGAERAATLVARLLAFSRRQPLAPEPIDVNRLVDGMSDLLRRTLGERVTVETLLADGAWACFADPGQLENAILNLAVNARDAMGASGGRLTIETANVTIPPSQATPQLVAGDHVLIAVIDNGSGMSPAVIARAFDPFFTTKEVGKGTGLGLSQVFGFVTQSGGGVAIASEIGSGTAVRIHLPRYDGGVIVKPDDALPAVVQARAGEVILVAEDEPYVRQISSDALRELGYTVLAAANGEEALRMLADQPDVALLFSDVVMPGMTGPVLGAAARKLRPGLRVLYTSGYTPDGGDGWADIGEAAMLPKPFTVAQLAAKVRGAIEGR
ncbi:CHASE3 domain-containing protein [Sphingomonas sp. MMS24-J13]|uniref:CHASE3 domain-containing protein n=1 Tax=Sphingomonas sp. MMS24-J13 TaxID=3238686 RepID=UPI00384BAB5D